MNELRSKKKALMQEKREREQAAKQARKQ